jgi:hypothetical protein
VTGISNRARFLNVLASPPGFCTLQTQCVWTDGGWSHLHPHDSGKLRELIPLNRRFRVNDQQKAQTDRLMSWMEGPFLPVYPPGVSLSPEQRLANAAEYAAHQLGGINQSLAEIVRMMTLQQHS